MIHGNVVRGAKDSWNDLTDLPCVISRNSLDQCVIHVFRRTNYIPLFYTLELVPFNLFFSWLLLYPILYTVSGKSVKTLL